MERVTLVSLLPFANKGDEEAGRKSLLFSFFLYLIAWGKPSNPPRGPQPRYINRRRAPPFFFFSYVPHEERRRMLFFPRFRAASRWPSNRFFFLLFLLAVASRGQMSGRLRDPASFVILFFLSPPPSLDIEGAEGGHEINLFFFSPGERTGVALDAFFFFLLASRNTGVAMAEKGRFFGTPLFFFFFSSRPRETAG